LINTHKSDSGIIKGIGNRCD